MKSVFIHQAAEREFIDILIHHEREWKGFGRDLPKEFEAVFQAIAADPKRFAPIDRRHRRAELEQCPFSVIYRELPDVIWIVGFVHHKQGHQRWKRRTIPAT